jgi:PAS domain-containing protein
LNRSVRSHFLSLIVTLASVGGAFALTLIVPALGKTLFIFLGAVMISSWQGGFFYGLLATLLSAFICARYVVPSQTQSVLLGDPEAVVRWCVFVLVALLISFLQAAREKSDAALRKTEERLLLALDSAHLGVWDYDLTSRLFWWSKTLEAIYGRQGDAFPRTYGAFFGCIHFDDQPAFNRAITRTIDEGTDYQIEHRILMPDKSVRWVSTRGRVIFNKSSKAQRIVGVTTAVTARPDQRGQGDVNSAQLKPTG